MSSNSESNPDHAGQHTGTSTGQDAHAGGNPKRHGNNHQTPAQTNTKNKANMSGNSGTGFRGDTEKMRGYVFEVPPRSSQMSDTLDMLKRYVRSNYKSAPLLCTLFATKPTKPVVKKPSDSAVPTGAPTTKDGKPVLTDFDKEIYKETVKGYLTECKDLERDMVSLFSVIFGQCNKQLRAQLLSQDEFHTHELGGDCLWLLTAIRGAMTKFDKSLYVICYAYGPHHKHSSGPNFRCHCSLSHGQPRQQLSLHVLGHRGYRD